MKKIFFGLAAVALCSGFSGCGHEDTYPEIPALEFKALEFGNSGGLKTFTLTATFTDGDGDIGYYQDRPNEPIFDDSLSPYYYNFVIAMQVYRNGDWKDTSIIVYIDEKVDSIPTDDDTLFYNPSTRLPYLTQTGQNKGLKGDIDKTDFLPGLLGDTIRFRAFIYDRALHKSNEIFTAAYFIHNP